MVLAINAAKVAYARQLNHMKILDDSFILNEDITPKNLDKKVAKDVTIIESKTLTDIFFSK